MNIDLSKINQEEFYIKEGLDKYGSQIFLVTPHEIGTNWTKENAIFRSSVWDKNGFPVSLGFRKFMNWSEHPIEFPDPTDLSNVDIIEKIDGSCLIVSQFGDIIRTRGTLDARKLDNGTEIDFLIKKYPKAFKNFFLDSGICSFIYEWTTPNNKIILNYGNEPDIYLVGVIRHNDYSYWSQTDLDVSADAIGCKRPKRYSFKTIPEMIETVQAFKGVEGVCIYFNNGQSIKKVKGLDYLAKHRFKSEMSLKNLLEYYIHIGMPDYIGFCDIISANFDYEIMQMAMPDISKICDAQKQVQDILNGMTRFVENKVRNLPTRKDQAMMVLSSYGNTGRSGVVFNILDNKQPDEKTYKMLFHQCLGE